MPAILSWPAVRRWLLLFLLFLFTAQAFANSITIGTLTFLGTSDPNDPHKPMFLLDLNTQGMTFDSHIPEWPYPLLFQVQVLGWDVFNLWDLPATAAYNSTPLLPLRSGGVHHDVAQPRPVPAGKRAAV